MAQIINQALQQVNTNIHLSNTIAYTHDSRYQLELPQNITRKLPRLEIDEFRGLKSRQRKLMKEAMSKKVYKLSKLAVIEILIENCNEFGVTKIAQKTIAEKLHISVPTVKRYVKEFIQDGILQTKKLDGGNRFNTSLLSPLRIQGIKMIPNIINLNLEDRDLNIHHYEENESIFDDSEKESVCYPKKQHFAIATPPSETNDGTERIMKSEWEVRDEKLSQDLQGAIEEGFAKEHQEEISTTIKRLVATNDTKGKLLKEVGKIAKNIIVRNIGGLLVSEFKKMMKKSIFTKPRDVAKSQKMETDALECARERLKQQGIVDPRLDPKNLTYDATKRYDESVSAMFVACLKEMQSTPKTHEVQITAAVHPQTWSERAYQ